jgi:hypothetical protein
VLLAILIVVSSVGLGTVAAFVPAVSTRALGPLRWLAMLATAAVVFGYLLPEAFAGARAAALVAFAIGLLVPSALHWLSGHADRLSRFDRLALEAGYVGVLVHQVGDGIVLGTYARLPDAQARLGVSLALAAHTLPLIAFLALSYRATSGTRVALSRCIGLAVASMAGVLLSNLVGLATIARIDPYVSALASGFLLHIILHDLLARRARAPH